MDWGDIEEILFKGTDKQIRSVKCPDCGGKIEFEFNEVHRTMQIRCIDCGTWTKGCKTLHKPRCTSLYGNKGLIY